MNRFKECREKAGYTQKEVSVDLRISVQAVSYWETGERMPSYEKLFQLADLYSVSLDVLLGRKDIPNEYVGPRELKDSLSVHETSLIRSYRSQPQSVQNAICDILHIDHPATIKAN